MYRGQPASFCLFETLTLSFIFCNIFVILRKQIVKPVTQRIFRQEHPKAVSSMVKVLFYGFISIYGYFVIKSEPWSGNVDLYHLAMGPKAYPKKFLFYYVIEFSYYISELKYLVTEYYSKDRYQLITHHFITISLISLSFLKDYARVGVVVMGLHDISDPFLESSKLFLYMENKKSANVGLILFSLVFISSRIVFYPYWILYPAFSFFIKFPKLEVMLCAVCLLILYILHIYWMCLIFKTLKKVFVKHEFEDARSVCEPKKTN